MKASVRSGAILSLLLCGATALAQTPGSDAASAAVFFDALAFAESRSGDRHDSLGAGGTTERSSSVAWAAFVDLYVAVPFAAVEFDRAADRYLGSYQATLRVDDSTSTALDTTVVRSLQTSSYARSSGAEPSYDLYQFRVPVRPGRWRATLEFLDLRSGRSETRIRAVEAVDPPPGRLSLSSLMLVRRIREDSSGYVISPLLSENVSSAGPDGYFLFFEAYNNLGSEAFLLDVLYRDAPDAQAVGTQRFERRLPRGRSQQWLHLRSDGLPRGEYVVEVRARSATDTTAVHAASMRTVAFFGDASNLPISDSELDAKIPLLQYVATQVQIDRIVSAPTYVERRRAYSEFWSALDPTPRTPENEAMEEYFERIREANERYRGVSEGWLTDMGRVHVIYGRPDRVETDPFRTDGRQTQTWHYYGRIRQFVFIDDSGFGDFRLLTPLSPGVKYKYGY